MNNKIPLMIGGGALAVMGVCLALLGGLRAADQHEFQQVYHVQTYGGTNYVIELSEVTVGKVDTGCVLIVSARVQNPNAYALTLNRDWFVLVDEGKSYYQPVTTGTQSSVIQVPANGVAEKEAFSYVIPDEALAGHLALEVGYRYFTLIKSERPYTRALRKGEFVMFRQRDW